jgi:hypothetical protein
MADDRMQIQRAVSLVAVQVNGDAGNRDMGHDERVHDHLPTRQIDQATVQEGQDGMEDGAQKIH